MTAARVVTVVAEDIIRMCECSRRRAKIACNPIFLFTRSQAGASICWIPLKIRRTVGPTWTTCLRIDLLRVRGVKINTGRCFRCTHIPSGGPTTCMWSSQKVRTKTMTSPAIKPPTNAMLLNRDPLIIKMKKIIPINNPQIIIIVEVTAARNPFTWKTMMKQSASKVITKVAMKTSKKINKRRKYLRRIVATMRINKTLTINKLIWLLKMRKIAKTSWTIRLMSAGPTPMRAWTSS